MTAEQFTYWLQGYAELNPASPPTEAQWKMIQEHLSLVFTKVTPPLVIETESKPFCTRVDFPEARITC